MEQQTRECSDEINLYDLWKVIVKRKGLIIGLFIVAVISTTIISFSMPKIYRGEALLNILSFEEISGKEKVQSKEIIQAKEIVDMIGNIDREKRTKIFPETSASVTDFKLRPIKDSKDKLLVTIEAKNAEHIGKALSEVVNYINNFDIVKITVREEKEKLLKRSSELSDVINSSANLSTTYRKLLNEGKLTEIGFNPLDFNKGTVDVKLEKLTVDQRLERLNSGGIEIAQQPYIQNHPVKPKIGLTIVLAAMTSIFLGILLVFFEYGLKKNKGTGVI